MAAFICTTCGTQYPMSEAPPSDCPICLDERQYLPPGGQSWTTLARLGKTHMNAFRMEAGLLGIGTAPAFGIGQRALLVTTPSGNILWDCISLLDEATIRLIEGIGGLHAIAISHPHYYTTMVEWSHAFGAPVYLHEADQAHIMRPDPCLTLWGGERKQIAPGATLIRCGGHFAGGTVLHMSDGKLLTGDILQVVADRKSLGFMWSYPNFIPLGAKAVRQIGAALHGFSYSSIHGAFWDRVITEDAEGAVHRSLDRHLKWIAE